MILESQGNRYVKVSIKFIYNNQEVFIESNNTKSIFKNIVDWLDSNGYKFEGLIHDKKHTSRKIFDKKEVNDVVSRTSYEKRMFHNINNKGKFILTNSGASQLLGDILKMLENFGIDPKTIKTEGFESTSRIKKFNEIEEDDEDDINSIEEEPVNKIKVYKQNPFKQSICILGESGSGKSVTIENILENEDHNFEFIIPTAATTGLLAQFSPSRSTYVPSRLGRMLVESSNNPDKLYTAVFDEMHKSNVIEMINDELLQAISTKRNKGVRFISLDDDTSEIYSESNLETKRGNLIIPDNFGFIFISSKPRVISNNSDFFNRVDIVILKEENRSINSSEELLNLKISEEEKRKLSSIRND